MTVKFTPRQRASDGLLTVGQAISLASKAGIPDAVEWFGLILLPWRNRGLFKLPPKVTPVDDVWLRKPDFRTEVSWVWCHCVIKNDRFGRTGVVRDYVEIGVIPAKLFEAIHEAGASVPAAVARVDKRSRKCTPEAYRNFALQFRTDMGFDPFDVDDRNFASQQGFSARSVKEARKPYWRKFPERKPQRGQRRSFIKQKPPRN